MSGLHTKNTVILAYTAGFIGILGFILIKQHTYKSNVPDTEIESAVDAPEVSVETPVLSGDGTYHIRTKDELENFIINESYWDKPIVVNFSNIKACDPCKANRPTYLLSAKFLQNKAYFVEVEENTFDDTNYFAEQAPLIPAFKIYKKGELVRSFAGRLRSRTQIRDELAALE